VDTASRLYASDLDAAARTQRPAGAPLAPHADILMDLIFIKEKGLLATCGLDRAVRLWGIENLRPRGTLAGHTRGVRALAYAQSLLVSGGFDNIAIVWDITSHERACTLAGHRAAICSIELVAPSREAVTVFTLDDSGECRVWHLARDASGATLHETIRLPGQDPQGPTRALCLPGNARFSVDDFPDMFVGGARLHHLVPVKAMREFAPPACCAYNSTSWHFVAAVGDRVHAWDARSGDYVQRFVAAAPGGARAADVSAACFDEPRQRRLFVGTDVGDLVVLNYVTGAVLSHARPHAAEVVSLALCADTKCLVSVGLDGLLHVHLDNSSALELLRSAEHIHRGAAVTCFAYSAPAALILTGDADGEVAVWCFQSLHQFAVIKLGAAAAALRVLDPLMIMLTADAHGELLVWTLSQQPGRGPRPARPRRRASPTTDAAIAEDDYREAPARGGPSAARVSSVVRRLVCGRGRGAALQAGPTGERGGAAARHVLRRAALDCFGHIRPRLPRARRGERAGEVRQGPAPRAQELAVVEELAAVHRRRGRRCGYRGVGRRRCGH
jgi:WD40 repeat protein